MNGSLAKHRKIPGTSIKQRSAMRPTEKIHPPELDDEEKSAPSRSPRQEGVLRSGPRPEFLRVGHAGEIRIGRDIDSARTKRKKRSGRVSRSRSRTKLAHTANAFRRSDVFPPLYLCQFGAPVLEEGLACSLLRHTQHTHTSHRLPLINCLFHPGRNFNKQSGRSAGDADVTVFILNLLCQCGISSLIHLSNLPSLLTR